MRQIARDWGTEVGAPYYDGIGIEYTNWDADSVRGCVCDPGWTGGACEEGTDDGTRAVAIRREGLLHVLVSGHAHDLHALALLFGTFGHSRCSTLPLR